MPTRSTSSSSTTTRPRRCSSSSAPLRRMAGRSMSPGPVRSSRGTSSDSYTRPRVQASQSFGSSAGMYRLVGLFSPLARAAYEMAYLFDDPILLDGTLYRSLTGGPHPSTPYEVGVPRTLDWFRTHRAIA